MILQTYPQYLYFRSLRTVALSISSYEEFRSNVEHIDYSRLKQRCRQKFLQETVTKTLVVKGSVILTDLTDEVVIMGNTAVAAGSFSDVWKGTWEDPIEKRPRTVALKFLRLVIVQNVREKLLEVRFFFSFFFGVLSTDGLWIATTSRGVGLASSVPQEYQPIVWDCSVTTWHCDGFAMV